MLHSIGATHNLTQDSLSSQEASRNIILGSDTKASIRASFSTVSHYILVRNKKDTPGGAYECLVSYIKDYYIWHPHRDQGYTGLRSRIWEGTVTVTGCLNQLKNTLTTDPELKEISIYLVTDSADFISEFLKFFTSQYEEYIKNSTLTPEQALTTVLDFTDLIF